MENLNHEKDTADNPMCWFRYGLVRHREDRTAVKLYTPDGDFWKSIVMPTTYYPVEGDGKQQVFTCDNTKELTDDSVLELFNSVKYKIGHCYENTENLVNVLKEHGYDAKAYVGWLFVSPTQLPIHHCWCVLNEDMVLDLSDEFYIFEKRRDEYISSGASVEEARKGFVSFTSDMKKLPNSKRCAPVGIPAASLFYVGCECAPSRGRKLYQDLISVFPDHECQKNVDENGRNRTQQMLHAKGLMP